MRNFYFKRGYRNSSKIMYHPRLPQFCLRWSCTLFYVMCSYVPQEFSTCIIRRNSFVCSNRTSRPHRNISSFANGVHFSNLVSWIFIRLSAAPNYQLIRMSLFSGKFRQIRINCMSEFHTLHADSSARQYRQYICPTLDKFPELFPSTSHPHIKMSKIHLDVIFPFSSVFKVTVFHEIFASKLCMHSLYTPILGCAVPIVASCVPLSSVCEWKLTC